MAGLTQPSIIEALPRVRASLSFSPKHLRLLLLGLGFATGMEFYTADSVNLVLTDITGSFGVSGDKASWSPTVYSSALFRGVPICFWLAGHIGHKSYLIAFILPFVGASVVSATCYSFQTMLVARAFQGLAGAGLVVWWRGSVYMLLPKPRRSESLMRVSTMLHLSSAFGIVTDQSIGRAGRLNAAFPRTRRD
jgi:MFS transporter, DHA2 family, multidrug resistance protein